MASNREDINVNTSVAQEPRGGISRREMGAMSAAAGIVAATGASAADLAESDVAVKTADGECDTFFVHPTSGSHPGVIIWTDIFGLRPVFRDMGRRLAAEGYSVLVPNPYYREGKAPQGADLDFDKPDEQAKLWGLLTSLTNERVATDAKGYVSFLDSQAAVDASAKVGTTGYCMGGRLIMLTAAAVPDRVGAAASFHGGMLVTDKPDSPHLLIPKMKAKFYFGISEDDDTREPKAKSVLRDGFAAANLDATIEVYEGALHGWCVDGGRERDGEKIYDAEKAEVAWSNLLSLLKTS